MTFYIWAPDELSFTFCNIIFPKLNETDLDLVNTYMFKLLNKKWWDLVLKKLHIEICDLSVLLTLCTL